MSSRTNAFVNICIFYLFLDIYTFFGLQSLFKGKFKRIYQLLYILTSLFVYYCFYTFYHAFTGGGFFSSTKSNFALGIVLTAIVSKMFFVGLMLIQDSGRWLYGFGNFFRRKIKGEKRHETQTFFPSRRKFLTLTATSIAAIPLFSMLYGITKGKYNYSINNLKLSFKDLPKAFNGFKIVQISDIHAGSLDSPTDVLRGIKMINDQKPDVILFTGDMVNSNKDEVNPYIDIFKQLEAKYGKFSVLGNHDYYAAPDDETPQATTGYWADFKAKFAAMGFHLMNNENVYIEKNGEKINLVGVENWGKARWFPKRGDLDLALKNTSKDDFCVLMSHDPTHWDEKILEHDKHIHLTLSGHTHGMQFGLNMPNFKWSPAQYSYKRWMGLYEEKNQYLYVNRGFGFLAFPGRVGMWPEITVIELTT
jgi:predicted MPP superfamily phosphohydrolase